MLKSVHVAVAVIREGSQVLIARRRDDKHQGGLLEFPGGKVEPGESVTQALARELTEEVAIVADPAQMRPLIQIDHSYTDKRVLLDVWEVLHFSGQPKGLEGQAVQWLAIDSLRDDDFPAANRGIIRALQLPCEWLITDTCSSPQALAAKLESISAAHQRGLLLRQPNVSSLQYRKLVSVAMELCQAKGMPLMLHGNAELLREYPGVAGVHLSQHALARYQGELIGKSHWLGISCHSPEELLRAADVGADYAFLSPVNATKSHPGQGALGWECFATWAAAAKMPVYGLGGLSTADISRSRLNGGQGIAGIRHWW